MYGLVHVAVNIFLYVPPHMVLVLGREGEEARGVRMYNVHVLYMLSDPLAVPIYVLGVLPITSAPHSP